MIYSKQEFEDAIYSLVAATIKASFNNILTEDVNTFHQNVKELIREFMAVMHIATSEAIVQIFSGMECYYEAINQDKEVH